MKVLLLSYRLNRGLMEGEEEVIQVEFTPEIEKYIGSGEEKHFIGIKMGNKVAWVMADQLKKVVDISL